MIPDAAADSAVDSAASAAKEAVASALRGVFDRLAEASAAAGEAFVDVLFVAALL